MSTLRKWGPLLSAYVLGVLGVASLVVMVPLRADLTQAFGFSTGQFGLLMGLIGISAALLAPVGGSLIDRFGLRAMVIAGAAVACAVNLAYWRVAQADLFFPLRLAEGFAFATLMAGGPPLILRTFEGRGQVVAMTLWSTATPVAISVGMALGGSFAATAGWRNAFLWYGLAFLLAGGIAALVLPRLASDDRRSGSIGSELRTLITGYRQGNAVRLGLILFLTAGSSLGINTILPSHLARYHELSIAAAANLIASANLAMIAGSVLLGAILASGARASLVYMGLTLGACVAIAAVLHPASTVGTIWIAFAAWAMMAGAAQTSVFTVLPRITQPRMIGLATGVLNQLAIGASAIAPLIFLRTAQEGWPMVIALCLAAWTASLALMLLVRPTPEPAAVPAP